MVNYKAAVIGNDGTKIGKIINLWVIYWIANLLYEIVLSILRQENSYSLITLKISDVTRLNVEILKIWNLFKYWWCYNKVDSITNYTMMSFVGKWYNQFFLTIIDNSILL